MAQVTTFRDDSEPQILQGLRHQQFVLKVENGSAALNDNIEVHLFTAEQRIHNVVVRQSGTLGLSCTVQARLNSGGTRTNLTPVATTAAAASRITADVVTAQVGVPADVARGDVLELLVGGAGITAAATITVDLYVAPRRSY